MEEVWVQTKLASNASRLSAAEEEAWAHTQISTHNLLSAVADLALVYISSSMQQLRSASVEEAWVQRATSTQPSLFPAV